MVEHKRTDLPTTEEVKKNLAKMQRDEEEFLKWPLNPLGSRRYFEGFWYELGEAIVEIDGPCLVARATNLPQFWLAWKGMPDHPNGFVGFKVRQHDRVYIQLLYHPELHLDYDPNLVLEETLVLALSSNPALIHHTPKELWQISRQILAARPGPSDTAIIPE